MDKKLIDSIAAEVIQLIREQEAVDIGIHGTLVLLASHLVGQKAAMETLRKKFKGRIEFVPVNVAFESIVPDIIVTRGADGQKLTAMAAASENIVLLAPKISQIENIANGKEEGIVEEIIIRSLLWGKSVYVLLDYERPRFKRSTFYERIGDALDGLTEMGVEILSYACIPNAKPGALSLVTEREVAEAFAKGDTRILCQKGAIVTPAAKDRAAELKIKIDG